MNQDSISEGIGDMTKQALLMAKDRVWLGAVGGRITVQTMNMEIQTE